MDIGKEWRRRCFFNGVVVIIITVCVRARNAQVRAFYFRVSVEWERGTGPRRRLRALAADAAGKLDVLGHDRHALLF